MAKTVFVLAGATEITLFLASTFGCVPYVYKFNQTFEFLNVFYPSFIGAVIRKRQIVAIYTYFLYAHFVINVVVLSAYMWMVENTKNTDKVNTCIENATDQAAAAQCTGVLRITTGVFIGLGSIILLLEFCTFNQLFPLPKWTDWLVFPQMSFSMPPSFCATVL
jgi:hypothetical protein